MAGLGAGGLIVVVLVLLLGGDPRLLLGGAQAGGSGIREDAGQGGGQPPRPGQEPLVDFVSHVLGSTEDVWTKIFAEELGAEYRAPKLVLFNDAVSSACGLQSAAVGPFYCPADEKAYIDLGFYETLKSRLGAPGDFAQAYVLAHEVGHHVQNLLGTSDEVHRLRRRSSEAEANELSVRLELQADFFAGVWAHHAEGQSRILEAGDLEEALNAAAKIGDDHLQRQAQGRTTPDSFTHGTSAQRVKWLRLGLETGDVSRGDTFKARDL
jgi:predicted metalloprotease